MPRFLIAILLTSCATSQPPRLMRWADGHPARLCDSEQIVVIAVFTKDATMDRVRDAADLWNRWLGHNLFRVVEPSDVSTYGPMVSVTEKSLDDPQRRGIAQLGHREGDFSNYASIHLSTRLFSEEGEYTDLQITSIIAHEFGHALGLQHTPYASDLMWPHIHQSDVVLFRVPPPGEDQLDWARKVWTP